jgi:hypothetical protein
MNCDIQESLWVEEASVYSPPTGDSDGVSNKSKERHDSLNAKVEALQASVGSIQSQLGVKASTEKHFWKPGYGTVAQWVGIISALVIPIWGHYSSQNTRMFNFQVDSRIDSKLGSELGPVNSGLNDLRQRMSTIEGKIDILTLQKVAAAPTNPKNAKQAKQIVLDAQKTGQKLDPEVVSDVGAKFIGAGTPDAWDTALSFLGYRSSLNTAKAQTVSNPEPVPETEFKPVFTAHLIDPNNEPIAETTKALTVLGVGKADFANSARMERLDQPNSTNSRGRQFIVFQATSGVKLVLDNLYLKNVIVRNTRVVYGGGPVRLQNAYFVNCTFEFEPTPGARGLATAVLTEPAVTFPKS